MNIDRDQLAAWTRRDYQESARAKSQVQAETLRVRAGFWLLQLKRLKLVAYREWAGWIEAHVSITGHEAQAVMSDHSSWLNAHRFDGSAAKFYLCEMALAGWKPEPEHSPAFIKKMQEALEQLTQDLTENLSRNDDD